jgi:hypothetical protein
MLQKEELAIEDFEGRMEGSISEWEPVEIVL